MNTILMGDWKSVKGEKSYQYSVRLLGLERRHKRCQMLIDLCERNGLIITRTWCRQPNIILHIWKAPALRDRDQYHLDYTLVNFQSRSRKKNVQNFPGVEAECKQGLIVQNTFTILKKIIRYQRENQDGICRNYMLNSQNCKTLQKKYSVQLNAKVEKCNCFEIISRNVS